eukprot:scaffold49465_cov14-Tisochrysis_lutea.AAC.1
MAEIAMKTPSIGSVHFISLAMIFFCCKDSKPKGKYSIGVLWMVRYGVLVLKTRVQAAANLA